MKKNINEKILWGGLGTAVILLGLILIISYFSFTQYQDIVTNLVYIYLGAVIIYAIVRGFQTFKCK